jgi:hypothetical protein
MSPRRTGKKDFDLERMYQKLVPSMQADEPTEVPDLSPEPLVAVAQEFEGQPFEPVNLMEYILLEKMDHTMRMLRACDCPRCRGDILALALNQLPSAYAVDPERFDNKVAELRRIHEVKVTSALIMAVQTVKANPRH